MTLSDRFAALAPSDRRLLVEAAALLAAVNAVLRLAGLTATRRVLAGLIALAVRIPVRGQDPARIAWAVTAVSRRWGMTCLGEALVTQAMFELRHSSATVRIGVRRGPAGELESHAWVECAGSDLPCQPSAGTYSPVLAFHRMRP